MTPIPKASAGHLAKGWEEVRLIDMCDVIQGQSPPGSTYNTSGDGLPFFQGKAEFGDLYPTPVKWCTVPKKIAEKDDVLISIRAPVGPTNICAQKACIGRGLAAIRPHDGIPARYVLYGLRATESKLTAKGTGSTFSAINGTDLKNHKLALAPKDQREGIVSEIEKQFTRLDAGVAALQQVQANLKRYRAAVLKAACEGLLVPTEETRWVRGTLGNVIVDIEAGKSFRCEERTPRENEIGVVKVSSVTWGFYNELESKTCLDARRIEERYIVRPDDFLFSRANTIELIGACVIAKNVTLRVMLSDKILRFRFSPKVLPIWVLYWLRSDFGRGEIERLSTGNQESMRNIGQERIRQISFKIPPLTEQMRIVAEVERRLSTLEELEMVVTTNLQRASHLRQTILKHAFEGRLVAGPIIKRLILDFNC